MNRILLLSFLALLTGTLAFKSVDLWSLGTNVDGDGIGIHFMGFEIIDRVPKASIPVYAIGFLASSLVTLLIGIFLIGGKCRGFENETY
jgi:tetrahydromethanopterin S-methyltransferase subunit C